MPTVVEVRASHILVDSKEKADALREEILKGKSFDDAAKENSKCPSSARGGDLGFFGPGAMVPEFEKPAFSLKPGEVSEPIKTQFGWHLIKVTEQLDETAVREVRASHLLVDTKEEAEKLRQEILSGTSFADVAKKVSKCPSSQKGGDLGFFGRGKMVPEFEEAAFNMDVNQVSEPIKTQFGWHLLVVTDKK